MQKFMLICSFSVVNFVFGLKQKKQIAPHIFEYSNFGLNLPTKCISHLQEKSEHHRWIVRVRIYVSAKFYIKETILNFGIKFAQKRKKWTSPLYFGYSNWFLGHYSEDTLTDLMLITAFWRFSPKGHSESHSNVGSPSLAKHLIKFELGTFWFYSKRLNPQVYALLLLQQFWFFEPNSPKKIIPAQKR